ncbi:MAG: hypothetical protein KDA31_03270 [Phycisphaerales bacterium]|nr:hypothetical protein [Phycisphaerales bacterium]
MNALEKLRQVVDEIHANADPLKLQGHWDLAVRLMSRFPVDQKAAIEAYKAKDFAAFDALLRSVEAPPKKADATAEPVEVTHEMREALKAFRKRLKLTKLDDESRLGSNKLSGGRHSQIDAIMPPSEFPEKVWKDLAKVGALRHTGQGFYELVPDAAL